MRTTSRGFTINYTVEGDGPPLVLVAGTLCDLLGHAPATHPRTPIPTGTTGGRLAQWNWPGVWQTLGVTDPDFQQMIEANNDRLAVAAAIEGSLRPSRFIDLASIRCAGTYYGQRHIGTFFAATRQGGVVPARPVADVLQALCGCRQTVI